MDLGHTLRRRRPAGGTRLRDYTALSPRVAQRRRLRPPQRRTPGRAPVRAALPVDAQQLVALLNHELRTPLTMMVGCAEILRLGDAGRLTEDQSVMVANVERGALRVQELVLDLLTLAGHALTGEAPPAELAEVVDRLLTGPPVAGLPGAGGVQVLASA